MDGLDDQNALGIRFIFNFNAFPLIRQVTIHAVPKTPFTIQGIDGGFRNANGNAQGSCNTVIGIGKKFLDPIVIEIFKDDKALTITIYDGVFIQYRLGSPLFRRLPIHPADIAHGIAQGDAAQRRFTIRHLAHHGGETGAHQQRRKGKEHNGYFLKHNTQLILDHPSLWITPDSEYRWI